MSIEMVSNELINNELERFCNNINVIKIEIINKIKYILILI